MCLNINNIYELKDNAILISDVHFNENRQEFEKFLNLIETKQIKTTQIILFGDIFDLLISQIKYTIKVNYKIIQQLDDTAKEIEVIYLEGNHDFNLKPIFKNIKVIPISNQPLLFKFKKNQLLFSHGDMNIGLNYKIYLNIIRNRTILFVLNFVDGKLLKDKIVKSIFIWLKKKNICKEFDTFNSFITKRLKKFKDLSNIDFIVEGHFHQGKSVKFNNLLYVNIPSFACEKSFFIIKSTLESFSFFKVSVRSFDVF